MGNSRAPVHEIDPLSLKDQDDLLLAKFLKYYRATDKKMNFYARHHYPMTITDAQNPGRTKDISIRFTDNLLGRWTKRNGVLVPRYRVVRFNKSDIQKDAVGSGVTGGVHRVLATLEEYNERMLCKQHKKRLIKICKKSAVEHHNKKSQCDEAKLNLLLPHLKAKAVTTDNDNDLMFLEIQEFKGKELFDVLRADKTKVRDSVKKISLANRLQITINILRALKEQFHDHGIAHRDIKPENILVDEETNEVNIFDAGFSLPEAEANRVRGEAGTPAYFAPEIFAGPYLGSAFPINQKSDLYSVGLTLGELWHAKERPGNEAQEYLPDISRGKEPADFSMLFAGIAGLTGEEQQKIRDLIKEQLMNFNPDSRPSLDHAISVFEEIKLNIQCGLCPSKKQQDDIRHANALGLQVRRFAKTKQQNAPQQVLLALQDLADDQAAMNEFVQTSGIYILHKLSKSDASKKIQALAEEFNRNLQETQRIAQEISNKNPELPIPVLQKLFENEAIYAPNRMAEYLHRKITHHASSINELENFNKNFQSRLSSLEDSIANVARPTIGFFQTRARQKSFVNYQLLAPLLVIKDEDHPLSHGIKAAIQDYINQTLSNNNIERLDRAASIRRYHDMKDILSLVNSERNPIVLIDDINARLEKIKTGFWGRSLLRDEIKSVIQECCQRFPNAVR